MTQLAANQYMKEFVPMLQMYLTEQLNDKDRCTMAKIFKILGSDAALADFIPPKAALQALDLMGRIEGISEIEDTKVVRSIQLCLRYSAPELGELLDTNQNRHVSIKIIKALAERVTTVANVVPATPVVQQGTYNPTTGTCYYFNSHGCKLRDVRKSKMNDKKAAEYDEPPRDACNKKFPVIQKKGVNHLFLWFCPMHGHCYGFHIIPGSEGETIC